MKIVIPMSGKGKRYNEGPFHIPKPLIEIDGKPMIEQVVNLFSPEDKFIFICHEEHLNGTSMRKILENLVPHYKIISLNDEQIKGGPLYTCSHAFDEIDDNEEVIINYCDFIMEWDYHSFLKIIRSFPCHGAIPSFKGFHPASLGDTYYAYMKINENNYLTQIKEKEPFSANRMEDYASTGTYYFKTGSLFKNYARQVMESKMNVNGEAYITLPYFLMIRDGLKILNYEIDKFICLGTPRDYEIYKFWSEFFFHHSRHMVGFNNINIKTTNIFPLAGDKRDFKELGFEQPNFLIPIMNQPLVASTVKSYPRGIKNIFICLEEHREKYQLDPLLKNIFHNSDIHYLKYKTGGNAATILESEKFILPESPVCISGCSYMLDYDERRLAHLLEDESIDVVLLTFTHHECVLRNPSQHSYIKLNGGMTEQVYEKMKISEHPERDHAFTGTAIYRRASDLFSSIRKDISRSGTKYSFLTAVNEIIKEGKKVAVFEVDKFVSLLNPQDYKEFIYWQDYFDKLPYHPYSKKVH